MKVLKRRKRERKTDYLRRLKLLKSGLPRIVFRKTNRYVISQYVESEAAQDKIIFGLTSKDLLKYGWPEKFKGSLKSIVASYLVGYLTGKKILKDKLKKPIIDLGMLRSVKKSKVFAFINGLIESGVDIKCPDENFPNKEKKEEILKIVEEVKSNIDRL